MRVLRRTKNEAALLIAIADIGGVWPVMQVTRALTELADTMVQAAVRFLLSDAARRDRLKPADPEQPEIGSGYIVLAMGKMGAFELNYSSDIDLIVFFDPDAPAIPKDTEPVVALYPRHPRSGEASAGAHRRRLRVPCRPSPAARPGFHADCNLCRGRRSITTSIAARTGNAPR